jgi:outer membrane protein assembly factor BamB
MIEVGSITALGDTIFVPTGNGVPPGNNAPPAAQAPSLLALNKTTGEVLWSDATSSPNTLLGQYSSPTMGVLDGVPQLLFAGGDGWLYSFDPAGDGAGHSELLWKFDCNPKTSKFAFGHNGTRKSIVAPAVVHDGLVYVLTGMDAESANELPADLWCIDPRGHGDVSPELVFNKQAPQVPLTAKRVQACELELGDFTRPNPNSAVVWHFSQQDANRNGKFEYEETFHGATAPPAIADGLMILADHAGLVHCVDAKTGELHWTDDVLARCYSAPLIVDGQALVAPEDGDVRVYQLSRERALRRTVAFDNIIGGSPAVADGVLYFSTRTHLFAIGPDEK